MKKIHLFALVLLSVVMLSSVAFAQEIYVEGKRISPTAEPLIVGNEIFVVLDDVARHLGMTYDWAYVGTSVRVIIGQTNYYFHTPTIINGELFVPLDFFKTNLGLYAYWNQKADLIIISRTITSDDLNVGSDGLSVNLNLATDKRSYVYGEPIAMALVFVNRSDGNLTLNFNSGQIYDIVLKREGHVVWSWSRDKAFFQAMQNITLNAHDFLHYVELIPAKELMTAGTGTFTLEAHLVCTNKMYKAEPITIQIGR